MFFQVRNFRIYALIYSPPIKDIMGGELLRLKQPACYYRYLDAIHQTAMIARIAQPIIRHLLKFILGHQPIRYKRYPKAMAIAR